MLKAVFKCMCKIYKKYTKETTYNEMVTRLFLIMITILINDILTNKHNNY